MTHFDGQIAPTRSRGFSVAWWRLLDQIKMGEHDPETCPVCKPDRLTDRYDEDVAQAATASAASDREEAAR